jgi:predicted nuclease of predicted toxin-antitoxin system
VRLLLDEHLSPAIAEELRHRGHDVVTAIEARLGGRSDSELLDWAIDNRRAVVTANYPAFRTLHEIRLSRGDSHFGIVLISGRYSLSKAGVGRLVSAIERLLVEQPQDNSLENVEIWLTD